MEIQGDKLLVYSRGRLVYVADLGQIMLASGQGETALARLVDIPICKHGKDTRQVENVLAAIGAAWALGISNDVMRTGVETFMAE